MAITTIPADDRYERFIAVGGQTVFPYNFPIYADADLTVARERAGVMATLTYGADYTVTGAGTNPGGNVTLTAGAAAGDVIVLAGAQQLARSTKFVSGGDFTGENVEAELNRMLIGQQQNANAIRRAITVPMTDPLSDVTLPTVANRAGKIFGFDAAGRISMVLPIQAGPYTASAYMAGVLLSADATAARTALGAATGLAQPDTTGSGSAYVLTAPTLPGTLAQGIVLRTRAHATSNDAPTLNLNGTGAKPIRRICDGGSIALGPSEWKAGVTIPLMYDAGLDAWVTDAPIGCQATLGQLLACSGPYKPKGTLWADGSAVSRTTYARLFEAMVIGVTGNTTSGNTLISAVPSTQGIAVGMPLSGPGIAPGAKVASFTGNSITMDVNANGTGTGSTIIIAPHGVGDGSTTFNLPDARGRALFGRDDMGAGAASRLTSGTSGIQGARVGAAGGDERMPTHNHPVSDPGHAHPMFDQSGSYGVNGGGTRFVAVTITTNIGAKGTDNATTGITVANQGSGTGANVPPALVCNWVVFAGA